MNQTKTENSVIRNKSKFIISLCIGAALLLTYYVITIVTDHDFGCNGLRKTNNGNIFQPYYECTSFPINVNPTISKQIVDQYQTIDQLENAFGKGINGVCVQVTHASPKGKPWDQYEHTCKIFIQPNSEIRSQGEPLPAIIFTDVNWVSVQQTYRPDGSLVKTEVTNPNADFLAVFESDEKISNDTFSKICNVRTYHGYECPTQATVEFYGMADNGVKN